MDPGTTREVMRFGPFEANLHSGQLRRNRLKLKLPVQSFQVLAMLLEHPGELVSREELRKKLWPDGTFVDFEHGLNAAVNRLREALGDSAEQPTYIETLPRRGYQFIGRVEYAEAVVPPAKQPRTRLGVAAVVAAVVLLALAVGIVWQRLRAPAPIRSLAVLPLENLSGDPTQEYFVDGMTEALTTDLAKISALKVISRASVMRYKETQKPLPEIAQELKVDAVVEGSVMRAGEKVRITVQLIEAKSDRHLWAESYERDVRDVLALQSELALAIATEINIKITAQEQARLGGARPVNPKAHEAYLRGRYYLEQWSPGSSKKAEEYFQQALAEDPNYALAYVGLAETYGLGNPGLSSEDLAARERAATMKALELDDRLGEAHAALADLKLSQEWDFAGAEQEFKRAIELNPNYPFAHHRYSHYLTAVGRLEESLVESRKYLELDPLSPSPNLHLGYHYFVARQYDLAIEQLRKTVQMDPNYTDAHRVLGQAYLGKGMKKEAFEQLEKALELSERSPFHLTHLAEAYAATGQREQAQKLLNELRKRAKRDPVSLTWFARIYARLDEQDKAFQELEKAYEKHDSELVYLQEFAAFDRLRGDRRYGDLVRRIGFPQ
ncbi:MAG: tetratricopeptide repeat protein [Candidatus Acidiferrales bacterium]